MVQRIVRTSASTLVHILVLLLHGQNLFAQAMLFGCEPCGLLSFQMAPLGSPSTCGECLSVGMLLLGYECTHCPPKHPQKPGPKPTKPPTRPTENVTTVPTNNNVTTFPANNNVTTFPTNKNGTSGFMTMSTDLRGAVNGSSCEYVRAAATARGSSWLEPYINQHHYCGANEQLYLSGMGCGDCFVIEYSGEGGTDPGSPGSTIVQVVDSGGGVEFNCFLDAFEEITGSDTGVFPITYFKVPCEVTGPTAVILEGNNAWFVKVLFAGGSAGVQAARMELGSTSYNMEQVGGANWKANLSGTKNQPVTFFVTFTDGTTSTITNCFGGAWPVNASSQCT